MAKYYSNSFVKAFTPVRWYLLCSGQLPFTIIVKEDVTHAFQLKRSSCVTFSFITVTILYSFIYIIAAIGLLCSQFDIHRGTVLIETTNVFGEVEYIPWDEVMLQNNAVVFVIYWTWLTMTFVGSLYVLINAKDYVHYLNYWNSVVQILDMELTKGIMSYFAIQALIFVVTVIILSLGFWFIDSFRASAGVIACLLFKFIIPDLPGREWFGLAQILGFVIVIYGFIGTKAIVIQFMFFTNLLKNGVACWNNRLRNRLYRVDSVENGDQDNPQQEFRRTKYRLLLKDHFLLVQLFKLTEGVFGLLLQFYYMTKIICLVVEVMFLWYLLGPQQIQVNVFQNSTNDPNAKATSTDLLPNGNPSTDTGFTDQQTVIATWMGLLMLFETIISFYSINEHATVAYNEAMTGFQIIRKHGFIKCNSSAEKNFIHSLVVSFARNNPMLISANGYFSINKALIISIVGTVSAYFSILIQFPPEFYQIKDEYRMKRVYTYTN